MKPDRYVAVKRGTLSWTILMETPNGIRFNPPHLDEKQAKMIAMHLNHMDDERRMVEKAFERAKRKRERERGRRSE